ncbi:MAG TPA: TetR family transcriptional regulator [Caulobacteraceae bacterium]|jgi:AcrR family transcriptional regulator|nr:TetR family transcriptional regulator [Caulobacteraceae bacterium]
MPRSGEDARRRLQQAALELFRERGYEATTTAEIAARAGVTERTFFRHFPDKREALFNGEEAFRAALGDAVLEAPASLSPMDALRAAFCSVEGMLLDNRSFSEPRQAVIAQTPALQERVLTKTAGLIETLAAMLRRRGVTESDARLAAHVGMAAFSYATRAWFYDPEPGLGVHLTRAFDVLQDLVSTGPVLSGRTE